VLDPARHDVEVALPQLDVAVPQLDRQPPLDDEEEVVGVRVRVPDELAPRLRDLDLVAVEAADDPRPERLVEGRELLAEVDRLVYGAGLTALSICARWSLPE
jgi:hypothetical protein